ncbi:Antigen-presenting glycoprotein CD1d [Lemmus lemmus]
MKPWSRGKFSDQQWEHLQRIFQVYRFSFTRDIQEFVKMLPNIHYPVEIQLSAGCDVYSENASENFLYAAFQGEYILSFQGTSFQKAPNAPPWTELVIKVFNSDKGTTETAQWLLYDICPQFVPGLLEAGKPELEKQEKPVAWLSSGLSPTHGHLQLVCHVSGFYPKPVWVMWMQGEQKQNRTQRSDYLPNADETWYLRATLDVEAGKEAGLACWVKHSSLGGQDIILYWVFFSFFLFLFCFFFLIFLFFLILFFLKKISTFSPPPTSLPHTPTPIPHSPHSSPVPGEVEVLCPVGSPRSSPLHPSPGRCATKQTRFPKRRYIQRR